MALRFCSSLPMFCMGREAGSEGLRISYEAHCLSAGCAAPHPNPLPIKNGEREKELAHSHHRLRSRRIVFNGLHHLDLQLKLTRQTNHVDHRLRQVDVAGFQYTAGDSIA